jgi:hypothetical protein
VNENTQANIGAKQPGIVSARRRLVGRAFAAPAVMTLFSGSAFAAASNMRCIANKAGGSLTQEYPAVGPADAWLRVKRYKLTLTAGGAQYWIKGSDVVTLKGSNANIGTHLSSTQFQLTTSPYSVQSSSPVDGVHVLVPDLRADGITPNFVAVRVNTSGNIVGIVGDGVTGATSAISQTCWSSFRG